MTELRTRIRHLLPQRHDRWYSGLADDLAARAWSSLARMGIDRQSYGTSRVLRGTATGTRLGTSMGDAAFGRPLTLELYDATMLARYGTIGLRSPRRDFDPASFEVEWRSAMELLDVAGGVGAAVRSLVWSVSPVGVEGPAYDTSYSDPLVPFSIFVGAHAPQDAVPSIRLAEGILHETMHLQLSLIEDHVTLVRGTAETMHSPWQMRPRPVQGVLHGLYVFRVVHDWLQRLRVNRPLDGGTVRHVQARLARIDFECSQLSELASSQDLTEDGRMLVHGLS